MQKAKDARVKPGHDDWEVAASLPQEGQL